MEGKIEVERLPAPVSENELKSYRRIKIAAIIITIMLFGSCMANVGLLMKMGHLAKENTELKESSLRREVALDELRSEFKDWRGEWFNRSVITRNKIDEIHKAVVLMTERDSIVAENLKGKP